MSASEQQAEDQVAQMREALRSVAKSRRISRVVGIVAVVVGLCIVVLFLWSLRNIAASVTENPEPLREAFTKRIQLLGLERKATQVAKEVTPVVQEETMALLKDLELPKMVMEEAQIMAEDLEPILRRELERVRPRLEGLLEAQKEKTAEGLRDLLEERLSGRFVASIELHRTQLETRTGLTEEKLAEVIQNLQTVCGEALANVIQRRTGDVRTEMEKIGHMLEQIPPLRKEMSQDTLLAEMKDVLLALLKDSLPDYPIAAQEFAPVRRAPPGPPIGVPPEVLRQIMEEERKAAEAARKAAGEGGQ